MRTPTGRPHRLRTPPREARVEEGWSYRRSYRPGQFDTIGASTLVLVGSAPPARAGRGNRLRRPRHLRARIQVLDDHGYMAYNDPILVADLIGTFVLTGARA